MIIELSFYVLLYTLYDYCQHFPELFCKKYTAVYNSKPLSQYHDSFLCQ